ncbi:MAG: ABC transporter ATP-binding protein [Candidatus Thermoplasmatota archaeon]
MIRTQGLRKVFDGVVAIDHLDLEVEEGDVFGFIGPNGAGKTTTMRILCCLLRPTSGRAFIDEFEVGREPDATRIRERIGLLPENPGLYTSLSAYENLSFYARLYEVPEATRRERIEHLLRMLDIWDIRDRAVATFSRGMMQKIAIVRALVHEPKYLFLDEPTASLDPAAVRTVREFILDLKAQGRTIFINTHNLEEASKLCEHVAIFNRRVLSHGRPSEMAKRIWGARAKIELSSEAEGFVPLISGVQGVTKVFADGRILYATIEDPRQAIPKIVGALVSKGAEVLGVEEERKSLEEIYLEVVEGSHPDRSPDCS